VSVVRASDVGVDLGGREIWSGATFYIAPATISVVLGPNGAGKSTLLRALLGLVPVARGRLEVFDQAPERGSRRVGLLAQSRAAEQLMPMTGRDLVGLGYDGTRFGWGRDRAKPAAVAEALALAGAGAFADRPLRQLSGGQRQRVAFAHATVFRPELLLLDEPLAGLDLAAQAEIADLINLVRDRTGAAVVVVAHDLNPLAHVTDQVLWIARRRLRAGTPDEVVTEATLTELYGHPIEIVRTPSGRRVIVGLEEEFAHPHPHGHEHRHESAHEHLDEVYPEGDR
jgi:zinc/manganese transport system ATP-binding protein